MTVDAIIVPPPAPLVRRHCAAVLVDDAAWDGLEAALSGASLVLTRIPVGPNQLPRYELSPGEERLRPIGLTPREVEVLQGMARGRSNADIGRDLFLAEDTIKTHARHLFKKLEVGDRAHAVAVGYQRGILGGSS